MGKQDIQQQTEILIIIIATIILKRDLSHPKLGNHEVIEFQRKEGRRRRAINMCYSMKNS